MFPNKCTLMPQCPSVNAQKEKKPKQNPERYQIICLTDKEAHLCLFSLCNAIALIAFPYLGLQGGGAANEVIDALSKLRIK